MEEDGTCLLDVINDPDALGAFLTSEKQDEEDTKQSIGNMDLGAKDDGVGSSSSSKPAYPDFLSMAMAEAELEPDFSSSLDHQEAFFTAAVDASELGGIPEQRTPGLMLESLVDDASTSQQDNDPQESDNIAVGVDSGKPSIETSAAAKTAISAVQRLISQSSQPLQHGALAADIPTQKMIHYTAEDHPQACKLLGESTNTLGGGIMQHPISVQSGTNQVGTNQQVTTAQSLDSSSHHKQTPAKQLVTSQLVQQSGQGLQLNAQLQNITSAGGQQQTGLQQVLIGQSHQLQTSAGVQQLVLGPVQPQIIGANVIQGQNNAAVIQQGHIGGHQVLQLQRSQPQLRPKMGVVLKQGGVVSYDGASGIKTVGAQPTAMKQIQLVLNPQTGIISQVPGNIQLTGQLIPQQPGMISSPQVIIQNPTQQHHQQTQPSQLQAAAKGKTITTSSTVSTQPVITMAASEGNIIVLTNSAPIAQPSVSQKSGTVTVNSSTVHVASSIHSNKQQKVKQGKSKTKSRSRQQRTSSTKPVTTLSVTTITTSNASNQSQSVQSLGSIPSIQTSSPLSLAPLSSASGLTSTGGSVVTRLGQSSTSSQSNITQHINIPGMKQGSLGIKNKDQNVTSGTSVHSSESAPVTSHQAGTVHYRPRQVVTKQQTDKNPALRQLVQNLRAQGDNERLRSLRELQKLLQQNPQASQQLQELMKSKLVGSKPEVAVKKSPVTSADVTKPPNVYLQPQPANSLPFQADSKLFNSSTSVGLTLPSVFIGNSSNTRTSHPVIVPTTTEVAKFSSSSNISGVFSSIVTQTKSSTHSEQDKDTIFDNLDFLETKSDVLQVPASTVGNQSNIGGINLTSVPTSITTSNLVLQDTKKIPTSANSQSWTSDVPPKETSPMPGSSDGPPENQATSQYSASLPSGTTTVLGNQGSLAVSSHDFADTIDSLVNSSQQPGFVTKGPSIPQSHNGKVVKQELIIGTSAIDEQGDQPGVKNANNVTNTPPRQPAVSEVHPQTLQSSVSLSTNPNSNVVSRSPLTLTSEQIGIRAQQQLQQIQARIQQLMNRQVRSDIENRQLQQLLQYRDKVIFKVKAQLKQLNLQQKLAVLSRGQQQTRAIVTTTEAANSASIQSSNSVSVINTTQGPSKAGGAFSSLLVPPGEGTAKSVSSGLNINQVLPESQQQQQYNPSIVSSSSSSSAGVGGDPTAASKQIQNALISSTTSKHDTLKIGRASKHKNGETDKKSFKKIKTAEPVVTLSQSLNFKGAHGRESGYVVAKVGENSLSNSHPAGQFHSSNSQGISIQQPQLSKTQVKSQQYQQTMRMLEEKLRSMSPAQQRQFLMQYQPLLQKLSLAGQKIMAGKVVTASGNNHVEQGPVSAQKNLSQGNTSKESKLAKRNGSKPVTPTLLQLISAEEGEAKLKHERLIKQQNRSEMLMQQLKKDQSLFTHAELKEKFSSRSDAIKKLLVFHICQDGSPTEEHLDKFDREFEDHSIQLLEKKDEMLAKYRYLLLRESMRRGPSAEMVMLDRMVLQDERMNFEYEKQLAKNPDTQNHLHAMIKPNQSKKQRFLLAATTESSNSVSHATTHEVPKQDPSLPPKKRALMESAVTVEPLLVTPKTTTSPEVSIKEPQITKNDFKTKITIKIPKQSYQPLSPLSPSSADTIHSTVSSPDLKSPKSEAGSDSASSSIRSDISSPRVRLRRHSTLQALLMSESPLDVSMEELKGKKKPWKQSSSILSDTKPFTKDTDKALKVKQYNKDGLTNGKKSSSSVISEEEEEESMSVFDFEEDTTTTTTSGKDKLQLPVTSAANSPFEPMDMLQDSLQDEMNSTINSILGLQKSSPGEGMQQASLPHHLPGNSDGVVKGTLLPSAVFESHSNDDDFYDNVETLTKFTPSYSRTSSVEGNSDSAAAAAAGLQAELDIMMEGDDSQGDEEEGKQPSDQDLQAAVNSILHIQY